MCFVELILVSKIRSSPGRHTILSIGTKQKHKHLCEVPVFLGHRPYFKIFQDPVLLYVGV